MDPIQNSLGLSDSKIMRMYIETHRVDTYMDWYIRLQQQQRADQEYKPFYRHEMRKKVYKIIL